MRHLEVLVVTEKTTKTNVLNWKVSTVNNVETAIENLQQHPYQVVALSKDVSDSDKIKLNRLASVLFDELIVVEYHDESALSKEVKTAYWSKNKPGYASTFLDNSFEIKLAHRINSK